MVKIVELEAGSPAPSADDGMTVTPTPSGKWEVSGAAATGEMQATFIAAAQFDSRDAAIRYASEWGEPRGVSAVYVWKTRNA